ncbi:MAG: hypothetical protein R3C53_11410 [Pirellulaceae bacterium]
MEDVNSITFRLESYLLRIRETNARWSAWMRSMEQAAMQADANELSEVESRAATLMDELKSFGLDRQQLLDDAAVAGLRASNLLGLARLLPAWERPSLRTAAMTAKQQLSSLRRLHVATWILISQRLQALQDSKDIMMAGAVQRSVYATGKRIDGEGGQLLDASL